MGPANGIIGEDAFATEMPTPQIDEKARAEIANAAKFSKTKEFKALEEHINGRIEFYQSYLPDGRSIAEVKDRAERGEMWIIANSIVGEFKALINAYKRAAEIIESEKGQ